MNKVGYIFSRDSLFTSLNSLLFFNNFSREKISCLKIVPRDEEKVEVVLEYSIFDCFVGIDVDILLKLFNYVSSKSDAFSVCVYYFDNFVSYVSRVNEVKVKREYLEFRFYNYYAFEVKHSIFREFHFNLKFLNKNYKDFKNYVFSFFENGACILF